MSERKQIGSVQIFGYVWPVYVVEGLAENMQAIGRSNHIKREIEICSSIKYSDQGENDEVLIHECLHAVAAECGVELDERSVTLLALGLHQIGFVHPAFFADEEDRSE